MSCYIKARLLFLNLIILVFIFFTEVYSGETNLVTYNLLKEQPAEFIAGWKFQQGNDFNWSSTNFDDTNWLTVNSLKFPDTSKAWTGSGWFRKKFKIDSSLYGKTLGMRVLQTGSSKIYLNGNLIHTIGNVSSSADSEEVCIDISYPKHIQLAESADQMLAVHYSNFTKPNVDMLKWHDGFYIQVGLLDNFIESRVEREGRVYRYIFIFGGIPLLFSMLHLFLYFFNRREIANLYYGILTFSIGIINSIDSLVNFVTDPTAFEPIFIISGFFAVICIVFLLLFAYDSFQFQIPKHFVFFIVVGAALNIVLFIDITVILGIIIQVYAVLAILEICRVVFISFYFNKIKPGFLVIGFSIFIITWLYQIFISFGFIPPMFEFPIFYAGLMLLIISMSIHLSQNFALINNELEKEIETVKELSKQKIESERIEKERELKQKLLAADNLRKTKELEEARALQLSMLPKELPRLSNLEIAAKMLTATEVGGDYYDFYKCEESLTFAIGDATGHGTKAGTLVSATKSLFNALVDGQEPLSMIIRFNAAIKKMNLPNLFMALLIGKINGNKITFSNSGMPPILVYSQSRNDVTDIKQKSMPIGGPANFPYTQANFIVESGDVVLFSSDGLFEVFNEHEEMLGLDGAKNIFKNSISDSPQNIVDNILAATKKWSNGVALRDDLTLVVISFK